MPVMSPPAASPTTFCTTASVASAVARNPGCTIEAITEHIGPCVPARPIEPATISANCSGPGPRRKAAPRSSATRMAITAGPPDKGPRVGGADPADKKNPHREPAPAGGGGGGGRATGGGGGG